MGVQYVQWSNRKEWTLLSVLTTENNFRTSENGLDIREDNELAQLKAKEKVRRPIH